jgi:hypothetical protein
VSSGHDCRACSFSSHATTRGCSSIGMLAGRAYDSALPTAMFAHVS